MGAEFIRRAAKSFRKSWDRGRISLGTSVFFTMQPTHVAMSAPFDLCPGAILHPGDRVTVETVGNSLVARSGLSEVARSDHAPTELLRAVQESCGIAMGTIDAVLDAASVAEVSIC